MHRAIEDPEIQLLATIASTLHAEYDEEDLIWEGSPFAWIKTCPSRRRGAIGEKLVAGWCAAREFNVTRSPDRDADRIINGLRTEIKFSTLWKAGFYKFQQLRDQNYDIAICLGISPFDAHCWVLTKDLIMEKWGDADGLKTQHGGRRGSDTAWLEVNPASVPDWLARCGGRLSDAFRVLKRISRV